VAANLLPKGKSRQAPCPSPLDASPIPLILGASTAETSLHPPPLTGVPMDQGAKVNPHRAYDDPDPTTRGARPSPSAQRAPTNKSSPLLLLLSKRYLLRRAIMTKRAHSVRIQANKRQHHPWSRTIGQSCARPRSRSTTGRMPLHLHSQGACPTSVGKEMRRT